MDWHRCRRYWDRGIPCPYNDKSFRDHEEDDQDDDDEEEEPAGKPAGDRESSKDRPILPGIEKSKKPPTATSPDVIEVAQAIVRDFEGRKIPAPTPVPGLAPVPVPTGGSGSKAVVPWPGGFVPGDPFAGTAGSTPSAVRAGREDIPFGTPDLPPEVWVGLLAGLATAVVATIILKNPGVGTTAGAAAAGVAEAGVAGVIGKIGAVLGLLRTFDRFSNPGVVEAPVKATNTETPIPRKGGHVDRSATIAPGPWNEFGTLLTDSTGVKVPPLPE